MGRDTSFFTSSILALMVVSLLFLPSGHATNWFGNDDGEFDVGQTPSHVGLREDLITAMLWSSSPPHDLVSMQYNPDAATTLWKQVGGLWFQTVIWSDAGGCGAFSIQVWTPSAQLSYRGDHTFSKCLAGSLGTGAVWEIDEVVDNCCNHIAYVYFYVSGSDDSSSYVLYPDRTDYQWLRSNLCWCGTDSGSTSFDYAWGNSTVYSDVNLQAIDPPVILSTLENSNLLYYVFQGAGTTTMSQMFGWPPPPYPTFTLSLPSSYQMSPCTTNTLTLTVKSMSGFYGTIKFRDTSPSAFSTAVSPTSVTLTSGSTASASYSVYVPCGWQGYSSWGLEGYTGAATYWANVCYPTNCVTGGSVASGTLITLANWTQVPVQNLRVGLQLLSYDTSTGRYTTSTITKFYSVITSNQMVIQTRSGKPLILDQNFAQKLYVRLPNQTITTVPATDLKAGYDLFKVLDRTWIPITSIAYQNNGNHVMYDIFDSAPGNYVANGYLDPLKT